MARTELGSRVCRTTAGPALSALGGPVRKGWRCCRRPLMKERSLEGDWYAAVLSPMRALKSECERCPKNSCALTDSTRPVTTHARRTLPT